MGRISFPASFRIAMTAIGLALTSVPAASAEQLAQASATPIPDGYWAVNGRGVPGTGCGDWFVRLSSRHGHLTGTVGVGSGNVPLHQVAVGPDGGFSGATAAHWQNSRYIRAYRVSGQFAGDSVTLTIENERCPARSGMAVRSGRA